MAKNPRYERDNSSQSLASLRHLDIEELSARGDDFDHLHGGHRSMRRQKSFAAAAGKPARNADGSIMTQEQIDAARTEERAAWVAQQKKNDPALAERLAKLMAGPQA